MNNRIEQCGIVILAAGQSSRLGRPKQLLEYHGGSLLVHAVETALETGCRPVFVVLGAHAGKIRPHLAGRDVHVVDNEHWAEGMASSIRLGLQAMLQEAPEADGILLMVCDQPFVTSQLLGALLETQRRTGRSVVASRYRGRAGTPAVFQREMFAKLTMLQGDTGARNLLMQDPGSVITVPFEQGETDIDTEEDYVQLLEKKTANDDC